MRSAPLLLLNFRLLLFLLLPISWLPPTCLLVTLFGVDSRHERHHFPRWRLAGCGDPRKSRRAVIPHFRGLDLDILHLHAADAHRAEYLYRIHVG